LCRIAYAQSPRGRERGAAAKKAWRARNPRKYKAQNAVNNAIRDGRLVKPQHCEVCGATGKIHGHHDDYDKLLEVRWVCPPCHKEIHKQ
jgi:hypothetical protein